MPQMIYSMVIKRVASGVSAIVGSLLFLFCCDCSNQQRHHGDAKVLSVELKHQDVNLEDLFERVEIIPLETNDSCLITKIVAAISTADYIYVLNGGSGVLRFSDDGRFINRIGAVGQGPGEYRFIYDFDVDSQSGNLFLLSPFGYAYEYTPDGIFVSRHELPLRSNYQAMQRLNDTCWVSSSSTQWGDDSPIAVINDSMTEICRYLPIDLHAQDLMRGHIDMSRYNGVTYAGFAYGPHIYKVTPDSVEVCYTLDFGADGTSEDALAKYDKELDQDPEVNLRRDEAFFADKNIKNVFSTKRVTDRYVYVAVTINDENYDWNNPKPGQRPTTLKILYDLTDDKSVVFDHLSNGMFRANILEMTDDYLMEILLPRYLGEYKDYLPEGMTLENIDVVEANPMLAKFYCKK